MLDDNARVVARSERLLRKPIGEQVVLYDLESDEAHLLSRPSAEVWRLAETPIGLRDLRAAAKRAGHDSTGQAAIDELIHLGLLTPETPGGISRRSVILGAGAAAVAAPLVTTILAPTAASATSHCIPPSEGTCTQDSDCCAPATCSPNGVCLLPVDAICTRSDQCVTGCCKIQGSKANTCQHPAQFPETQSCYHP